MILKVKSLMYALVIATSFFSVSYGMQPVVVEDNSEVEQVAEEALCPLCSTDENPKKAGRALSCGHELCTSCLVHLYVGERVKYSNNTRHDLLVNPPCPFCSVLIFNGDEQSRRLLLIITSHRRYIPLLRAARELHGANCAALEATNRVSSEGEVEQEAEEKLCPLCSTDENPKIAGRLLACGHELCTSCLVHLYIGERVKYSNNTRYDLLANPPCPFCRAPIFNDDEQSRRLLMTIISRSQYIPLLRAAKELRRANLAAQVLTDREAIETDLLTEEELAEALALQQVIDAGGQLPVGDDADDSDNADNDE